MFLSMIFLYLYQYIVSYFPFLLDIKIYINIIYKISITYANYKMEVFFIICHQFEKNLEIW